VPVLNKIGKLGQSFWARWASLIPLMKEGIPISVSNRSIVSRLSTISSHASSGFLTVKYGIFVAGQNALHKPSDHGIVIYH
jgi:hypothetical protein